MKISELKLQERATQIRKAWKSKKYKTHGQLAVKFGVSIHHVKAVIQNRVCIVQKAPEGIYKPTVIQGRKFFIYDDGRVWSVKTNRFLNSYIGPYKVIVVRDIVSGKMLNYRVHRLMLELFVRKPNEGEVGRHLDDNPANLTLSNLAWGTPYQNSQDMKANNNQKFGVLNNRATLTEKEVKQFYASYDGNSPHKPFVRQYMQKVKLDVEPLQLLRILRGVAWTHVTGITDYKKKFEVKLTEGLIERILKAYIGSSKTKTEFSQYVVDRLRETYGIKVTRRYIIRVLDGLRWNKVYAKFAEQLSQKHKDSGLKLDEKAVHAIHKNWAKTKLNQMDFCRRFALYLKDKGYDVAFRTIKKVLRGGTWKEIYKQYN